MDAQPIIQIGARLFGLGEPHPEPIDMHAPDAAVHDSVVRGMSRQDAIKKHAVAVIPPQDSSDWLQSLRLAVLNNDKLQAKRFLLGLAGEIERLNNPPKEENK